ncbi:MAG: alanyl-tRNA editing protein [Kordiimonadaceae bacterium]|jgi:misacylated tRNA(Ala) deacylase|nr:alanyl-tRNA editing protein [Kordiimonadaceae bacterium]MBT6036812.1 alanyl-tRNA editing protein [Kordiimonadaceae bacterium]MBT6329950.1 alanyl-tRNA editing protein [Kordiimonadaceae bacterium]
MTEELFREDAYLKTCDAKVVKINDLGGIVLDKTIFYPTGGGQPGDSGKINDITIATTVYDRETGEIVHVPAEGQSLPDEGSDVTMALDWERRYLHMRMHTGLHLLCAAVPCGVTGGQIGAIKSRLDFDIGEMKLDKEEISEKINAYRIGNHEVTSSWISDDEMDANEELVRTMSVKPPRKGGRVRLMKVGDAVDLQPCGGTHVKNTSEIGPLRVSKIENKGKRNRRVNIVFDEG